VKNFLFTSSGAAYGKQPFDITHMGEEDLFAPDTTDIRTSYGQSKRMSEFLCTCYSKSSELKMKIARCFAFVGPGLPLYSNYAIGNFIGDVLNERPSYLYAADLAVWLWSILFRGQAALYNVGSDEDLSIFELANKVIEVTDSKQMVYRAKEPAVDQVVGRYVPSINRARLEMGLMPWISLPESIRRTFNYHKSGVVSS
jgi:dTDP-glucose 4,6-dehydratase